MKGRGACGLCVRFTLPTVPKSPQGGHTHKDCWGCPTGRIATLVRWDWNQEFPVSYGPGFFLLGELLPWSARDLSQIVLNWVAVCPWPTPPADMRSTGFETAVGRGLLVGGARAHCRH